MKYRYSCSLEHTNRYGTLINQHRFLNIQSLKRHFRHQVVLFRGSSLPKDLQLFDLISRCGRQTHTGWHTSLPPPSSFRTEFCTKLLWANKFTTCQLIGFTAGSQRHIRSWSWSRHAPRLPPPFLFPPFRLYL